MTTAPATRSFDVRHVQLARAAFAAIAAVMVTFSPDHSAVIGLSIFSGFALATGLVLLAAGWFVHTADTRWPSVGLGSVSVIAGMVAGIAQLRIDSLFFVIVISWALLTGLIEIVTSARALQASQSLPKTDAARTASRDGLTVGILTAVLGLGLLAVPAGYALQYTIDDAHATFTLTGIIIGVGIFGGYAAILAVYLAIAGLSPRRPAGVPAPAGTAEVLRESAHDERGTA